MLLGPALGCLEKDTGTPRCSSQGAWFQPSRGSLSKVLSQGILLGRSTLFLYPLESTLDTLSLAETKTGQWSFRPPMALLENTPLTSLDHQLTLQTSSMVAEMTLFTTGLSIAGSLCLVWPSQEAMCSPPQAFPVPTNCFKIEPFLELLFLLSD